MSQVHSGWVIAGAIVIVALVAGAIGYLIGGNQPAAVSADDTLVTSSAAVWSTAYDPARVAAVYAAHATFRDGIAGETSTGLEAIQAKVAEYATYGFNVVPTSTALRQGDYVINFFDYGTATGGMEHGISVFQVADGKIVNQWAYPAN
jgi:hypothetical protein